ncbi:MAG: imidazoleglycerol-phosphate dehydratase, partial [Nitrosarchaeum sp.]|nr:imidazoleglycerol-phosphate dehydratase [Nitrosarchaeum sp.]
KFRIRQSTAPVKNMTPRKSSVNRSTKETSVSVSVNLDGTGKTTIQTGINFLDHLITAFGKHGMMDLKVSAKSNDKITHHLIEDTAITMGLAIDKALGTRSGITRFSYASVPMDESLAEASIDLVKRPFWKLVLSIKQNTIEDISKEDLEHFFQSLLQNLNSCIHLTVKYGDNDHHKVEAAIKSLAVAFREASSYDKKQKGIPSTKGSM